MGSSLMMLVVDGGDDHDYYACLMLSHVLTSYHCHSTCAVGNHDNPKNILLANAHCQIAKFGMNKLVLSANAICAVGSIADSIQPPVSRMVWGILKNNARKVQTMIQTTSWCALAVNPYHIP